MIYTLKNERLTVKINSLGAELTSVTSASGYEFIAKVVSEIETKKH